ncbi:hypothetical protein [Chitinophaga sp. RAB17]|uniref:hypothetical protein n=1 Tax=Chitinophaga sp. RAB17 TaxID=3233049 RepID=UPI003F907F24
MEKTKELGYGQEFWANDNGAPYPAHLPQEDLRLLAYKFTSYLLGVIDNAEVRWFRSMMAKALIGKSHNSAKALMLNPSLGSPGNIR